MREAGFLGRESLSGLISGGWKKQERMMAEEGFVITYLANFEEGVVDIDSVERTVRGLKTLLWDRFQRLPITPGSDGV